MLLPVVSNLPKKESVLFLICEYEIMCYFGNWVVWGSYCDFVYRY